MKRIVGFLWICLFVVTLGFADETNLTLTVDGITYNNVRFVRPTPATVTIYHSTGVATIPLAQLPPDLQKRFGYDPKAATQWELAQQQIEAQSRATAAVEWKLRVQSVLPDSVIAWGRPSASPKRSKSITILLVNPPGLHKLAEGDEITATAYRDGNAMAHTRTLEKWICLQPVASPITEQPKQ